jgi:hypothetical protein
MAMGINMGLKELVTDWLKKNGFEGMKKSQHYTGINNT